MKLLFRGKKFLVCNVVVCPDVISFECTSEDIPLECVTPAVYDGVAVGKWPQRAAGAAGDPVQLHALFKGHTSHVGVISAEFRVKPGPCCPFTPRSADLRARQQETS